jgi:hypothetical protein
MSLLPLVSHDNDMGIVQGIEALDSITFAVGRRPGAANFERDLRSSIFSIDAQMSGRDQ